MSDHTYDDTLRAFDALPPGLAFVLVSGEGACLSAAQSFAEFASGLNWHIDAEELTLFPAFEQSTGVLQGPTTVLRQEHLRIRRGMDEVAGGLRAGDRAAAEQAIGALTELLADHNIREEQVLYPMTDRAVQDARERDDLADRIQAT